jgi:hypothetical protein
MAGLLVGRAGWGSRGTVDRGTDSMDKGEAGSKNVDVRASDFDNIGNRHRRLRNAHGLFEPEETWTIP